MNKLGSSKDSSLKNKNKWMKLKKEEFKSKNKDKCNYKDWKMKDN